MAQPQFRVACVALATIPDSNRRRECGRVFDTHASNIRCPACGIKGRFVPWPSPAQLRQAGFVQCQHGDGAACGTFVNPHVLTDAEKPDGKVLCVAHRRAAVREQRRARNSQRRQPRVPYIPRDGGRAARIAERDGGGQRSKRERERAAR